MQCKCPTCGKPSTGSHDNSYFPFCSERCRLIDLDNWLTEKNKIISDDVAAAMSPSPAQGNNNREH